MWISLSAPDSDGNGRLKFLSLLSDTLDLPPQSSCDSVITL